MIEISAYKPLSSVTYRCAEKVDPVQMLAAIPVCVGASVYVQKKHVLHVAKTNPPSSCGVITSSTIMIHDDVSHTLSSHTLLDTPSSHTPSQTTPPSSSCTAVVQQLIDR
ncbi:hypothetical protein EON65_53910, partial [archaeon]